MADLQADLDSHKQAIDELHAKIASQPTVDKEKLTTAVVKLKVAFDQFSEDAQACVSPR
jgi:hypothetical protein